MKHTLYIFVCIVTLGLIIWAGVHLFGNLGKGWGADVDKYYETATETDFPFKTGYSADFSRVYIRMIGFVDKTIWASFSGPDDKLISFITTYKSGYDDVVQFECKGSEINESFPHQYRSMGWDLKDDDSLVAYISHKGQWIIGINHGAGRLYYYSFQL